MREILFRGKAINRVEGREYRTNYKNGDWVYGLVTSHYVHPLLPAEMRNENGIFGIEVDYKTIGQYTGLTDKNGLTKVFEGDIVKVNDTYTGMSFIGVVKFGNGSFYIGDSDSNSHYRWNDYEVEVIGNVFDNSLEELQNGN